jgi:hypothetical protein
MSANRNGLIAGSTTFNTGDPESYLYVRRGQNGDAVVDGDLTVEGDLFVQGDSTLPVIRAIDISGNPIYIRNPENIGSNPLARNAVVIEGGANRDISGDAGRALGVGLATYKPFSDGTINEGNAEDIGLLTMFGVNSSGSDIPYAQIRASSVDPTAAGEKGRLDFNVRKAPLLLTMFQMDGSNNYMRTLGSGGLSTYSRFVDREFNLYPGAVKITDAGTITKQTSATLVTESSFTIPDGLPGYYSVTTQVLLSDVSGIVAGDIIQTFLDVSGGSLTPVNGTVNISPIVRNAANFYEVTHTGIIMERLIVGDTVRIAHLETGTFTFGSGGIKVAYTYLGDTAL